MQCTLTTDSWQPTTAAKTLQSPISRPRLAKRSSLAASQAASSLPTTGYRQLATAANSLRLRYEDINPCGSDVCHDFFAKCLILNCWLGEGRRKKTTCRLHNANSWNI